MSQNKITYSIAHKIIPYIASISIAFSACSNNDKEIISDSYKVGKEVAKRDYIWNSKTPQEAKENIEFALQDLEINNNWAYQNKLKMELEELIVEKMYSSESIRNEFRSMNDDEDDVKKYFSKRSNWNSEGDLNQEALYKSIADYCSN